MDGKDDGGLYTYDEVFRSYESSPSTERSYESCEDDIRQEEVPTSEPSGVQLSSEMKSAGEVDSQAPSRGSRRDRKVMGIRTGSVAPCTFGSSSSIDLSLRAPEDTVDGADRDEDMSSDSS